MKKILLIGTLFFLVSGTTAQADIAYHRRPETPMHQFLKAFDRHLYRKKVLGSLLGSALGDVLGRIPKKYWIYGGSLGGNMFAQSQRDLWRHEFPTGIHDLTDFRRQDFVDALARYTDDTQMSLMNIDALLEHTKLGVTSYFNPLDEERLMIGIAQRYAQWAFDPNGGLSQYRAPGVGCTKAARRLYLELQKQKQGERLADRWWAHGEGGVLKPLSEGGCGSVMRAFPFALFFPHDKKKAIHLAEQHSLLTHRVPMARAACAAMAAGVVLALTNKPIDDILQEMIDVAGTFDPHTAAMMREARDYANKILAKKLPKSEEALCVRDHLELLEGKLAHQAIASTVFVVACENKDLIRGIQLAINFYGDADSIGAMVGALLGAHCGSDELCRLDNYDRFFARLEDHGRFFLLADEIANRVEEQLDDFRLLYPCVIALANEIVEKDETP